MCTEGKSVWACAGRSALGGVHLVFETGFFPEPGAYLRLAGQ